MVYNKKLLIVTTLLVCLAATSLASRRSKGRRGHARSSRFPSCLANDTCPDGSYKIENMPDCRCVRPTERALEQCQESCPMNCTTRFEFTKVTRPSGRRRRTRLSCSCDCVEEPDLLCETCDTQCEDYEVPVYTESGCQECGTCRNLSEDDKDFFGCPVDCDMHLIRRSMDGGLFCDCQDETLSFSVSETV